MVNNVAEKVSRLFHQLTLDQGVLQLFYIIILELEFSTVKILKQYPNNNQIVRKYNFMSHCKSYY